MHINGDDGPALGASYIAANYTAGVKVKKLVYHDGPNYEVKLNIKEKEGNSLIEDEVIFAYKENYGTKKNVTLANLDKGLDVLMSIKDDN